MSALRRANGFTLSELIIAVGLASVIFAGLASMYSVVFRAAASGLHQELMQASETFLLKHMERDFVEATYLKTPAVGAASNTTVEGYYNLTDYGGGKYSIVDAGSPVQHFVYLICPAASPPAGTPAMCSELYYWRETSLTLGANPSSGLPGSTITCGQAGSASLLDAVIVKSPVFFCQTDSNTPYFTRTSPGQVLVQGYLDRPATQSAPEVRSQIYDIFTASSQGAQP